MDHTFNRLSSLFSIKIYKEIIILLALVFMCWLPELNADMLEELELFQKITAYELQDIPPTLLEVLKKYPNLQKIIIVYYFARKKSRPPLTHNYSHNETIQLWQDIVTNWSLEDLYYLKYAGNAIHSFFTKRDEKNITSEDFFINAEVVLQAEAHKSTSAEKENDALTRTCKAITQQHGFTLPPWITCKLDSEYIYKKEIITVSKNTSGSFVYQLGKSGPILILEDAEVAGILGHELGHAILHPLSYLTPQKKEEVACDRFSCFKSPQACLGLLNFLQKVQRHAEENFLKKYALEERIDPYTIVQQQSERCGEDDNYPSATYRIKKIQKVLQEIAKEKEGLCKNPFYKELSSQKWFSCKKP